MMVAVFYTKKSHRPSISNINLFFVCNMLNINVKNPQNIELFVFRGRVV